MNKRREVLLEFQQVGSYLKATAVDPETLTEVSVVGPLNAGEQLRRTAMAKLDYVLAKGKTAAASKPGI